MFVYYLDLASKNKYDPKFSLSYPPPPFLIAILVFLYEQWTQLSQFKTKTNHV